MRKVSSNNGNFQIFCEFLADSKGSWQKLNKWYILLSDIVQVYFKPTVVVVINMQTTVKMSEKQFIKLYLGILLH
jgi:hypothetical protein